MPLTATLLAAVQAQYTSPLDLGTPASNLDYVKSIPFANGTGLNQADKIWHDQRTLGASASENIDLAGVLTDAFGATFTLARIKGLLVAAAAGNTNNVHVARDATNGVPLFLAASDGIIIPPGGAFLWAAPSAAGIVVTAGTGDLLVVTNGAGGTSVTYDIVVVGGSA